MFIILYRLVDDKELELIKETKKIIETPAPSTH